MSFIKVIKRNGAVVDFDIVKIENAIAKAGDATKEFDHEIAKIYASTVFNKLNLLSCSPKYKDADSIALETIQDTVENVLLNGVHKEAARAYLLWRDSRRIARDSVSESQIDLINNYLNNADWKVKENSNMQYSLQGMHNYLNNSLSSQYWLNHIYPKDIAASHIDGDYHIHDLGMIAPYCCGWSLEDLLTRGFGGVPNKIASSPAKHFRTALGQLVNFLYSLQGECAGAQAVSNFDTLLAPFVFFDQLDYKKVKQAMQEFIFNMNVSTRVGFQCPFSNITLDLQVPSMFKDTPVIYGGKRLDNTYGEFQKEMDMINKAFCEVMTEGDAAGRIFSFPIPTYNIDKEFDWENEAYVDLWKMTGKRGIPYFSNFVNSDMNPEDARSMCCRLRLDNTVLRKRGGGLFGANPLTGSLNVITINMARLGYCSKSKEEYINNLDALLIKAKQAHVIKRKTLKILTEQGLYPYSAYYLKDIKERTGDYWINHFNTIGVNGMNESCVNFLGKTIASDEGKEFALFVMDHIRERMLEFQEETGELFNLEATPAESTAYTLALKDRKKYPDIKTASSNEAIPFYTNSTHLPVDHTDDIFELLDLQDKLQTKYTGGTVIHVFIGEEITDPYVVRDLVKRVCFNYELPYFSITPTFSTCDDHGYIAGEQRNCPTCGGETEVYSRVVGYYRPTKTWNESKQVEFDMRSTFLIPE